MKIEIPHTELVALLERQLESHFGLKSAELEVLLRYMDEALARCERCFDQSPNKYYHRGGAVYFNPFHSVQYMTFLYYLGHTIYKSEPSASILCDKLYYLNKALNGLDLFYAVELPDFFMAEHPVGSVIGRAQFGSGFSFMQNCTVGGIEQKVGAELYPTIGENVSLYAGASVIGQCVIGNNVGVGAGTLIKNQDVPDDSNVFGHSPNLIIKHKGNKSR